MFILILVCVGLIASSTSFAQSPSPESPESPAKEKPTISADTIDRSSISPTNQSLIARGVVFFDKNADGKFNATDQPLENVKISNGREITKTDKAGIYELPLVDDSVLFLIKPAGYRTALDKNNLPKFFYIHKPNGSPKLKFPGSQPTGSLPQSIDFPLYEQQEPEKFSVILFGDPQPRNNQEVDYISQDVVSELIGNPTNSSFGVSLGDLAFDNLDTFEPLNQSVALIGIPWYNVIGNHDINLDAVARKHINETYEAVYGPSYYSYDCGQVHFVVLDNIDWESPTQEINRHHFGIGFGSEQLEFLKNDLALIPVNQMVVLMMHVPVIGAKDKTDLFALIEDRPLCISISAHTHDHQHLFLGKQDGFNGPQEHHHIVNVTVCGSWWSGQKDERGIPHATMTDGAPNGYSILTFDGDKYQLEFKGAGRPASEQMLVELPDEIPAAETDKAECWVNVYNGSVKSTVEMTIDDLPEWVLLKKVESVDPNYVRLREAERNVTPPVQPSLHGPRISSHLWRGELPGGLAPGTHLLKVRTTDMHGRTYSAHRSFRVVE